MFLMGTWETKGENVKAEGDFVRKVEKCNPPPPHHQHPPQIQTMVFIRQRADIAQRTMGQYSLKINLIY